MAEDIEGLARAAAEGRAIITEYPYIPRVRDFAASAGGRAIISRCELARDEASQWIEVVSSYLPDLARIPLHGDPEGHDPFWINGMIPGLDGMLLYALIRKLQPKTYLEVGSGNSTKFVAKAIRDGGLSTRVISIDPHPRAVIDDLCSRVIRKPFEEVDPDEFMLDLAAGDVVYIDNSHRGFQNSDVTVFFTETLPALPGGVIYGIHDIFLPRDYPKAWIERFYNEQYYLVCYLLGGADGDDVIFPGIHCGTMLADNIRGLFDQPEMEGIQRHAGAFWMRRRGSPPAAR